MRRITVLQSGLVAVLLALIMAGSIAYAQGGDRYPPGVDPDDVYKIARKMYCDVCQGVPLADCPSDQCRVWREEIADLLAQGRSESQIRRHFAERYGDKVSGVPVNRTSFILTYLVPLLLIGLVTAGIAVVIIRWHGQETRLLLVARAAGTEAIDNRPVPDNVDPVYLERVLKALEQYKP